MLDTSDLPLSKEVEYLVPDEFKEHSVFNELSKERNSRKDDIASIRRILEQEISHRKRDVSRLEQRLRSYDDSIGVQYIQNTTTQIFHIFIGKFRGEKKSDTNVFAERCEDKESSGYNELKDIVSHHFPEHNMASFVNMADESINKRNRSVHSIKGIKNMVKRSLSLLQQSPSLQKQCWFEEKILHLYKTGVFK